MSRYCKTQGQVLSDTHWCETCPQIEPEPNWRSLYEEEVAVHKFTRELLHRYMDSYREASKRVQELEMQVWSI
jgi:hypothetical protein